MKRLVALLPVLIAFQAGAPPALAWTWPVEGPVLRPFELGDDPYAGGQHRGVDIAGEEGAPVRSPAAGVVSFAGTVPGGGRAVTVQTADGYSVTLVHLGSIAVDRDAVLPEGARVATIGPSGEREHPVPYVHLGIRVTSDATGYLDPLSFLPTREAPSPAAPAPPAEPAPAVPPAPAPEAPAPEAPAPAPEAPAPTPAPEAPAPAPVVPIPVAAPTPAPEVPAPALEAREERERDSNGLRGAAGMAELVAAGDGATSERRETPTSPEGRGGEGPSAPAVHELPRDTLAGQAQSPAASASRSEVRAEPADLPAPAPGGRPGLPTLAASVLALGLGAVAILRALHRRKLGHAAATDAPPAVLDDGARRSTEDALALRPAEENGLVLDRDFERVALGQPKALADLNGDDDPAELVQMANDACRRRPALVSPTRFHRVAPRPSSRCRGAKATSAC
jgi:Peptidase family M23